MSDDDDNAPPLDIQIEIMKRLPIKPLLKFRSVVSKLWKSIIQSSDFIADYNHRHTHHQKLMVFSLYQKYVDIFDDDDDDDNFPKHESRLPFPLPLSIPTLLDSRYTCDMIGYSQGLFCFCFYDYNYDKYEYPPSVVVIWNPSIRKSVDVPVHNVLQSPYHTVFGFGFCNATDPIIVKIFNNNKFDTNLSRGEVFTLSTGVWTSLSNTKCLPRISLTLTSEVVVIGGFIYWLAFDGGLDDYRIMILSFDATSEEFKEIYLPPSLAHTWAPDLELSKLRESLVVLYSISWREYDVWMREDGVQNSFKKLYTVKPPPGISRQFVRGFRNNGQPIVHRKDANETRLFVYEPDSECFSDIGRYSFSNSAGSYMETLLLLDH